MKKLLCLLPLIVTLCGCGDARETNTLSPVSALAVGKTQDGIVLTIETAWQDSTEGSVTPEYLTAKADTIPQSFAAVSAGVGSDLYFSHAQVLIVDIPTAQHDMLDLCDYLCTKSEIRLGLRLAVSRDHPSDKILKAKTLGGEIPGFALEQILAQGKRRQNVVDMPFFRFYNDLLSGKDAALPAVTLGMDGQAIPDGTAHFKDGRLTGFTEGAGTDA